MWSAKPKRKQKSSPTADEPEKRFKAATENQPEPKSETTRYCPFEFPDVVSNVFYSMLPAIEANARTADNVNVFASAELLERASQQPGPSAAPPCAAVRQPPTSGFVVFANHYPRPAQPPPPSDPYFNTQLPVSNTQLDRLCQTADRAQATTPTPIGGGDDDKPDKPTHGYPHRSPVADPAATLRDAILHDFDCLSPNSAAPSATHHSPIPEFRHSDQLRTYSKQRAQRPTGRQLFGRHASGASSHSDMRLDALSSSNDSVDGPFDVREPDAADERRPSTGGPPVNLNRSGTVRENIMELSFYFSQLSPEPALAPEQALAPVALAADNTADDVNAIFKRIMWSKACQRRATDCSPGESCSFAGFGESVTLHENFDGLGSSNASSLDAAGNVVKEDDASDVGYLLLEDDDLFAEIGSPVACLTQQHVYDPPKQLVPNFGGFTTGHGMTIAIADDALRKAARLFDEIDAANEKDTPATDPISGGFTSGRGVNISVSSKALEQSPAMRAEDNAMPEVSTPNVAADQQALPYQTKAWTRKVAEHHTPDNRTIAPNDWQSAANTSLKTPGLNGFSTGRGCRIPVTEAAVRKAARLFENIDDDMTAEDEMHTASDKIQSSDVSDATGRIPIDRTSNGGFSTGRGAKIAVSRVALERSRKLFEGDLDTSHAADQIQMHTPIINRAAPNRTSTPLSCAEASSRTAGFSTRLGNDTCSSSSIPRSDRKVALAADDLKTPLNRRPMPGLFTQEITASTKALLEDEMLERESAFHSDELAVFSFGNSLPSAVTVRKSLLSSVRPTRLASRFDESAESPAKPTAPTVQLVSTHVLEARLSAQRAQDERIRTKTAANVRPGRLYMQKMTGQRVRWPEFVLNERPFSASSAQLRRPAAPVFSFASAGAHTFDMSAACSGMPADCCAASNTDGVQLNDDMRVHLDARNHVGVTELRRAFLCSRAVDGRLVHPLWVAHHYALIVHKLAAIERAFPDRLGAGRTLCLPNVALQLKLRYDVEIDRAQRSILHRICERDAAAGCRMVVFVLRSWSEAECDVSDGQYVVRTLLDGELARLWRAGRIAEGTKLMVHGADLVGLTEGCSPLELPPTARLRLYANSTRRVRWHCKLGACRQSGPFRIGLDSVLPSGGRIGCLRLRIVRVYAMLYVDKSKTEAPNTVLRSERMHQRLEANSVRQLADFERLYSQVSRELEQSERPPAGRKSSRLAAAAATRISQLSDVSQVYELLRNADDPEAVERRLSAAQKRELLAYQSRQLDMRADLVRRRVLERLSAGPPTTAGACAVGRAADERPLVTPLLKMRVVDAAPPAGCRPKTAVISVWHPHEELLAMLRENATVDVRGASACGIRNGDLQLTAGRSTHFDVQRTPAWCPDVVQSLQRTVTPIAQIARSPADFGPTFNELDTVGVVVRISEMTARKFQSVYVAAPTDSGRPAVLCINFWAGLRSYAYDDLVVVGRPLAARDLQWRLISAQSSIPCTFATEFTCLTEHPRQPALAAAMRELRQAMERTSAAQFAEECATIIDSVGRVTSTTTNGRIFLAVPSPHTPTDLSTGTGQPASAVQRRIDKLSSYGDAPPLSPFAMPTMPMLKGPHNGNGAQ